MNTLLYDWKETVFDIKMCRLALKMEVGNPRMLFYRLRDNQRILKVIDLMLDTQAEKELANES